MNKGNQGHWLSTGVSLDPLISPTSITGQEPLEPTRAGEGESQQLSLIFQAEIPSDPLSPQDTTDDLQKVLCLHGLHSNSHMGRWGNAHKACAFHT